MPPFQVNPAGAAAQGASTVPTSSAQQARERAIAILNGKAPGSAPVNSQPHPVGNPTQVAPEEMSAVKPTSEAPANVETAPPAGQESTSEAAPEQPASQEVTKPKEEPLSQQYAKLAREQKALWNEIKKFRSERDAFKAEQERAKGQSQQTQIDPNQFVSKDRLLKDTLTVLQEQGISYDQLTQMALHAPSPEQVQLNQTIAKLEAKIQELESKQTSAQKSIEDSQQQSYQQALNQIRTEAKRLVYTDPEFETIKSTNSVDDVVDLIETTFKEGLGDEFPKGTLLSVEEAAKMVEEHLIEEAMKIAKLSKIQKRLAPAPAPKAAPQAEAPKQQSAPKTLTNAVGTTPKLSARDRAILAMQGKLK